MIPTDEGALAVVVDTGSSSCRVGFAGEDSPRVIETTAILDRQKGLWPIERGRVVDWERLEVLWWEALNFGDVGVVNNPLLFTESTFAPKSEREKIAQIVFESLHSPAVYFSKQPSLALYSMGKTTGLVLDVGHGVTQSVPVVQGWPFHAGLVISELGGMDLTEYFQTLTDRRNRCELLKERMCEVSLNPRRPFPSTRVEYSLPDGEVVTLRAERFQCPEALFRPEHLNRQLRGLAVQEVVYHSIQHCDLDTRRAMYANIELVGGSTMFRNFKARMAREMATIAQSSYKIAVNTPLEGGRFASWLGGSIFASLSTLATMWITKGDYEESGPGIVHRKCN